MKDQEKEIKTIKERNIVLKLSDADCDRIALKAGRCGLTVDELLTQFIGDLTDGTYSNGSDERNKANDWFGRCWFGMLPKYTLLSFILDQGSIADIEDILICHDEWKYYQENPEEYAEEVKAAKEKDEPLWFEHDYFEWISDYTRDNPEEDIEKQIEICRKWFNNLQELKGEKENE